MILHYDPRGLGLIEMFGDINIQVLPGMMPDQLDTLDDWDDSLMQLDILTNSDHFK